jgi:hypothetical protein
MTNTINGRTPEEIKKGLECSHTKRCIFKSCHYYAQDEESSVCIDQSRADALFLINQLQEDKKQLERERDAAVEAAHGVCKACIHFNGHYPPGDIMSCCKFEECLYGMDEWDAEDHWQWRGVQEVE